MSEIEDQQERLDRLLAKARKATRERQRATTALRKEAGGLLRLTSKAMVVGGTVATVIAGIVGFVQLAVKDALFGILGGLSFIILGWLVGLLGKEK